MMAHTHKSYFVYRRNGRINFNRPGWGRQFSRLLRSRGVPISGSNAGYTVFRGSVKGTGYPIRSSVSPLLPLPCVTVCHHISIAVYAVLTQYSIGPGFDSSTATYIKTVRVVTISVQVQIPVRRTHASDTHCLGEWTAFNRTTK